MYYVYRGLNGWMDGGIRRQSAGWINGQMNEWMDGQMD